MFTYAKYRCNTATINPNQIVPISKTRWNNIMFKVNGASTTKAKGTYLLKSKLSPTAN